MCRLAAVVMALTLGLTAAASAAGDAVVLMYHRVGDGRFPSTNIRVEQFEAHLDYLAAHDFTVLPLAGILRRQRRGEDLPERAVAITFDDAYASVHDAAHPRLRERGWPYTVFVATDPVDRGYADHLSWDRMRAMAAEGARFANHSASHDHLIRRREGESQAAWRERVSADIARARERLVRELGDAVSESPRLFAYPYGEYDAALAALVRERGYVAFGQQSGVIGPGSDPRALPRFAFNERYAAMSGFIDKVNARPLPVAAESPWSPVIADGRAPDLRLTLDPVPGAPGRLNCFFGGGRLAVTTTADGRVRVRGEGDLPPGRSRYNCTLPAAGGGFHWYSHLWINAARPAWD